jgi:hypothetical protein
MTTGTGIATAGFALSGGFLIDHGHWFLGIVFAIVGMFV